MDKINISTQNGKLIEFKKEIRKSRQRKLDELQAIRQQRLQLTNQQNNQNI